MKQLTMLTKNHTLRIKVHQPVLLSLLLALITCMSVNISYAQDKPNYVTKSMKLTNHGTNATTFNFGKAKVDNGWKYIVVKLYGDYETMFGQTSQNFTIDVQYKGNTQTLFRGDLYKEKILTYEFEETADFDLNVAAKLISVNGASSAASGSVEVTAYREGQDVFYVDQIIYDFKNAHKLDPKNIFADNARINNRNGSEPLQQQIQLKYSQSTTESWETSTEKYGSVTGSVTYQSPTFPSGSVKVSGSVTAGISKGEKEGKITTTSKERTYTTTYTVKPGGDVRLVLMQTESTQIIPYTIEGYVMVLNDQTKQLVKQKQTIPGKTMMTTVYDSTVMVEDLINLNSTSSVYEKILE